MTPASTSRCSLNSAFIQSIAARTQAERRRSRWTMIQYSAAISGIGGVRRSRRGWPSRHSRAARRRCRREQPWRVPLFLFYCKWSIFARSAPKPVIPGRRTAASPEAIFQRPVCTGSGLRPSGRPRNDHRGFQDMAGGSTVRTARRCPMGRTSGLDSHHLTECHENVLGVSKNGDHCNRTVALRFLQCSVAAVSKWRGKWKAERPASSISMQNSRS